MVNRFPRKAVLHQAAFRGIFFSGWYKFVVMHRKQASIFAECEVFV